MRYAAIFALGILFTTLNARPAFAVEHVACHNCAKFVQVSDKGAGFRRESKEIVCCGECIHDHFKREHDDTKSDLIDRYAYRGDEWFDNRYIFFEDGTFVDMGHFFAAADVAEELGGSAAWGIGWGVEWFQEFNEWLNDSRYQSGAPFGANEDVLSNTLGVLYGEIGSGDVMPFVETAGLLLGHGSVSHSSNKKPN